MTRRAPSRVRLAVEVLLALAGVVLLGWNAVAAWSAWHFDREQRQVMAAVRRVPAANLMLPVEGPATIPLHGLVGILDIPRLGLSEVIAEGDDNTSLDLAVGHLPDTPLPWRPGNAALAAHRDSRFAVLKGIRVGDRLNLSTPHGDFAYVVRETRIVRPDDLSVLAPSTHRLLTLITCYPFTYIGHAPKRFVVQATALGDDRGAIARGKVE